MTTVWKGTLEFGQVSIPVRMGVAAREIKMEFRLINPQTGSPVRQRWEDAATGQDVKRTELVRAADVDGCTVLVSDLELAELQPDPNSEIDLVAFVKADAIDPLYFSASYYLLPLDDPEDAAYHLVAAALEAGRGYGAVGSMVLRQRFHHIIVRATGGVLVLHTLYRAGEVRQPEDLSPAPVGPQELRYARRFIKEKAAKWAPERFVDHHRQELLELVRRKRQEVAGDLTAGLKASVAGARAENNPTPGQGDNL